MLVPLIPLGFHKFFHFKDHVRRSGIHRYMIAKILCLFLHQDLGRGSRGDWLAGWLAGWLRGCLAGRLAG